MTTRRVQKCENHKFFRQEGGRWVDQHGRVYTWSEVLDAFAEHRKLSCMEPMMPPLRPPLEEDPFHTVRPPSLFDVARTRKPVRFCSHDSLKSNPDGTIEFIRGEKCQCQEKGEAS